LKYKAAHGRATEQAVEALLALGDSNTTEPDRLEAVPEEDLSSEELDPEEDLSSEELDREEDLSSEELDRVRTVKLGRRKSIVEEAVDGIVNVCTHIGLGTDSMLRSSQELRGDAVDCARKLGQLLSTKQEMYIYEN
jgi:hypothetical protein